jgi:hypothetical protein
MSHDIAIHRRCEHGRCVAFTASRRDCAEERLRTVVTFARESTEVDETGRAAVADIVRDAQSRTDFERVIARGIPCSEERNSTRLASDRATHVGDVMLTLGVPRELIETRPGDPGSCTAESPRVELWFRLCR